MNTSKTDLEMVQRLTECTLATVDSMAMKKSRSKYEFKRHIGIAQEGIDWLRRESVLNLRSRVADVIVKFNGDVSAYALSVIEEFYPKG